VAETAHSSALSAAPPARAQQQDSKEENQRDNEARTIAMRSLKILTAALFLVSTGEAFQNLFSGQAFPSKPKGVSKVARSLEDELLAAIDQGGSRLDNSNLITGLVDELENTPSIPEPAIAPEVYGRWRLLYTTNADTSSPIQRRAVDTQKFAIFQDIIVNDKDQLQVNQVVKFSDKNQLSVDALASTAAYPLPELTERQSTGKILGLNLLGVSMVGEEAQPNFNRPNSRIEFVFDEGNFAFGSLKVPYPVPFRLPILRDAVKGWIDVSTLIWQPTVLLHPSLHLPLIGCRNLLRR
jgi:hypothetical protein